MEGVLFIAPTVYSDGDRVAPLPCRRLTPVNSAVRLLGCQESAAKGSRSPPFLSTAGQLVIRGCGPDGLPSMKAAVGTTVQRQILILKHLR